MQVATCAAPPDSVYAEAETTFAQTMAYLSSREALQMRESDLERELHRRGQELIRQLLQGHLDQRGPGEAAGPVAGADGVERLERRVHQRRLETTFGTVDVERVGYGRAGVQRQLLLPVGVNYFCRLRGSEISIEDGDACVACGRRLRRPKRGGKRAFSTVTRSPGRSRAFSTPLAGCTGPLEVGSRTAHRAGAQRDRSRPRTRSEHRRRGPARFRTAEARSSRIWSRKIRSHRLVT